MADRRSNRTQCVHACLPWCIHVANVSQRLVIRLSATVCPTCVQCGASSGQRKPLHHPSRTTYGAACDRRLPSQLNSLRAEAGRQPEKNERTGKWTEHARAEQDGEEQAESAERGMAGRRTRVLRVMCTCTYVSIEAEGFDVGKEGDSGRR